MLSPSLTRPAGAVVSGRPKTEVDIRAEENRRLVHTVIARRFSFLLRDPDRQAEAFTSGYVELLGACARWDEGKGYTFSTYAYRCIEGGILRWLQEERRQGHIPVVSLETPIGDRGGELADVIPDPQAERPGAALAHADGFEALLSGLPARHAAVLRALFWEERSPAELAEAWDTSRQRIHQLRKQALEFARRAMAKGQGRTSEGRRGVSPAEDRDEAAAAAREAAAARLRRVQELFAGFGA